MVQYLTLILSVAFLAYIGHSVYTFTQIFQMLTCTKEPCFTSYLSEGPKLQYTLFSSESANPASSRDVNLLKNDVFPYDTEFENIVDVPIPDKTRRNGTLFLHVVVALVNQHQPLTSWSNIRRDGPTVIQRISISEYAIPKATLFLMDDTKSNAKKAKDPSNSDKPVAHFKPKIYFSMLTDLFLVGPEDVPPEMAKLFRINQEQQFLPIVQNDFLQTRLVDLVHITKDTKSLPLTVKYKPMGIGKMRLLLHMQHAMLSLKRLGFSTKDLDDIKGAFSDTNIYLLCGTIIVSSVHLLFDFLSFKNDIGFWRSKKSYEGLSVRTTLWRGFSHIVIFLYLLDSDTSKVVLVPAALGTLIELWKCKKILKIEVGWQGLSRKAALSSSVAASEELTKQIDREGMKYLSYLLYPLCIGGAIYSLVYHPHKSWYSWTVSSMVNGVYAFGFLFMLPQLFINYKLKSVAALSWRSFMYKAFNTFIDDIFAFIITMPSAHRLACFRDDIVFMVYLYQRWLYPVDKSRVDNERGTSAIQEGDGDGQMKEEKKVQ